MIDLHCHILPGLDDGALDLDDTIAMARQADRDGIELICATPHIRDDHEVEIVELRRRVDAVNAEFERQGVLARVATGGEVAEANALELSERELRLVSLGGGGRWILLEPAPGPLSDSLAEVIAHLELRGCRALIAHPERHLDAASADRLAALVARGALVQATAAAVAGADHGPLFALAERGLVHVLGSDAHSSHGGRAVELSAGLARLAALETLAPYVDWIAEAAPSAIVRGEDVTAPY